LHGRTIDIKMMLVDFYAVEPSGKIAMRVLLPGPAASGFFWNAAQSEVICSAEDEVGAGAIRRSLRKPVGTGKARDLPSRHSTQTNSQTLLRPN
jgi:hypothetical protein